MRRFNPTTEPTPPQAALDLPEPPNSDAALRRRWRLLVEWELPAAAADRDWPVSLDHCFARILLDAAHGRPWRDVVPPPAWRNTPTQVLAEAVALGEEVLAERQDLNALNELSLTLRGRVGDRSKGHH